MTPSRQLVSVVIPTYNARQFLNQAVASVANQTFRNLEVIIVDDGSTDGTEPPSQAQMGDIPLRYVRQSNQGPSAARNRGLAEAAGEFIAFLDADDLWLPSKLEHQMQYFRQHFDYGLVYTDIAYTDAAGKVVAPSAFKVIGHDPGRGGEGWVFERELLNNFIFPSTVVMRRCIFDDVGLFDPRLVPAEMTDLFLRISRRYQVGCVPLTLAKRRRHKEALTATFELGALPARIDLVNRYSTAGQLRPIARLKVRRLLATLHVRWGRYQLGNGERRAARRLLLQGLRHWPSGQALALLGLACFPAALLRRVKGWRARCR